MFMLVSTFLKLNSLYSYEVAKLFDEDQLTRLELCFKVNLEK
jgi:hypothetical protein